MKHSNAVALPKNIIGKAIYCGWFHFLHFFFGCSPFWFGRYYKTGKPYMRTCTCCGRRQKYIRDKWKEDI